MKQILFMCAVLVKDQRNRGYIELSYYQFTDSTIKKYVLLRKDKIFNIIVKKKTTLGNSGNIFVYLGQFFPQINTKK